MIRCLPEKVLTGMEESCLPEKVLTGMEDPDHDRGLNRYDRIKEEA